MFFVFRGGSKLIVLFNLLFVEFFIFHQWNINKKQKDYI